MKIFFAGATGAIGLPAIRYLLKEGHEVYGITQSIERSKILEECGANPIILDVLNKDAVFDAIAKVKPHVIVDMLTHLPKEYTPEAMREAAELDAKIRQEGRSNLLAAAKANGTKRYIAQSCGFWYEPGPGLADENTPFAFHASPGIAAGSKIYAELENRLFESPKIDGVALRFGFFYGPGTWFHKGGNMDDQVQKQQFPIIGNGEGFWNFVHIEDAATAIVLALKCPPGAYNIVNDKPVQMKEWLPSFAQFVGAPKIPKISEEEGKKIRGADFTYYATTLRGASNEKAKRELHFQPRPLEWLSS